MAMAMYLQGYGKLRGFRSQPWGRSIPDEASNVSLTDLTWSGTLGIVGPNPNTFPGCCSEVAIILSGYPLVNIQKAIEHGYL